MPEGDTLFRTATTLRKALLGRVVDRFDTREPLIASRIQEQPLVGRQIKAIEARGKHLLILFRHSPDPFTTPTTREPDDSGTSSNNPKTQGSGNPARPIPAPLGLDLVRGDLVLHTHLRMTGSWHIYRPGEAWQKPERLARAVIHTDAFIAPCFSAPIVELLTAAETCRMPDLLKLGPDAMTEEFDAEEAFRRLRRLPDLEISVALLYQRAMAGVGNVYKSEVLFVRRVSPFRKVRSLSDDELRGLVEESHRLMRLNENRGERRTVFRLDRRALLWVYGRDGKPCRVCGAPIRLWKQGLEARITFYCQECQK